MSALSDAATQAWPPFVLVAGLLAIGAVAEAEGVFRGAAGLVTRPGRSALAVLAGLLLLDAAVTAVLNLDTAAAFMTPLMVYAARGLGADERPYLYGAVLMANAASLLLPGANLTNLLVLEQLHLTGREYVAQVLPAALAAVVITGAGLLLWARGRPVGEPHPSMIEYARPRRGIGIAAVALAGVLVVVLRSPAIPVLVLGALTGAVALARRTLDAGRLRHAVGPASLLALFALATLLGTVAREWGALEDAVSGLSRPATTAVAALASVLVNNLPAATLLSAHPPEHPVALLLGLDLGPNLAITGSLSALIWWRAARGLGAKPSAWTYSRAGAPLAILAMAAGLLLASHP